MSHRVSDGVRRICHRNRHHHREQRLLLAEVRGRRSWPGESLARKLSRFMRSRSGSQWRDASLLKPHLVSLIPILMKGSYNSNEAQWFLQWAAGRTGCPGAGGTDAQPL